MVSVRHAESVHGGGNRLLAIVYAAISGLVLTFWGGDGVLGGDNWHGFVAGMLVGWMLDALLESRWELTALRFLLAALLVAAIGMAPLIWLRASLRPRHAYRIGVFAGCTLAAAGAEWARSCRRSPSVLENP